MKANTNSVLPAMGYLQWMSDILILELQFSVQPVNATAGGLSAEHIQCKYNLQQGHQ